MHLTTWICFFIYLFIEISKIETPRYIGRIQLGYYGMTRFLCFSLFMFDVPSIHNVCSNLHPFLSIMFVLVQVSNHKFFKFPHNTLHSYFSTTSSFFKRVNLESSFEDLRWLRIDCVFFKMYAFDNLDMFFYFFIEITKIEHPGIPGVYNLDIMGWLDFYVSQGFLNFNLASNFGPSKGTINLWKFILAHDLIYNFVEVENLISLFGLGYSGNNYWICKGVSFNSCLWIQCVP